MGEGEKTGAWGTEKWYRHGMGNIEVLSCWWKGSKVHVGRKGGWLVSVNGR